jgi:hypothetical protein
MGYDRYDRPYDRSEMPTIAPTNTPAIAPIALSRNPLAPVTRMRFGMFAPRGPDEALRSGAESWVVRLFRPLFSGSVFAPARDNPGFCALNFCSPCRARPALCHRRHCSRVDSLPDALRPPLRKPVAFAARPDAGNRAVTDAVRAHRFLLAVAAGTHPGAPSQC